MDKKSPDAFRTISEVAEWLGVPTHVLRFWESRFSQVKPVKRAGGRRYYRPSDMMLLGGIRKLLHEDGMTIRGVQKLLREEGVKHIAALSPALDQPAMVDVTPSNVVPLSRQDETAPIEDAELLPDPAPEHPPHTEAEAEDHSTPAFPFDDEPMAPVAPPATQPDAPTTDITADIAASTANTPDDGTGDDDDVLDSPEALDFLAHDADIAPPDESPLPAWADIAHIPPDASDDEIAPPASSPAPGAASLLRRARNGHVSASPAQLQGLADRLQTLAQHMRRGNSPHQPL